MALSKAKAKPKPKAKPKAKAKAAKPAITKSKNATSKNATSKNAPTDACEDMDCLGCPKYTGALRLDKWPAIQEMMRRRCAPMPALLLELTRKVSTRQTPIPQLEASVVDVCNTIMKVGKFRALLVSDAIRILNWLQRIGLVQFTQTTRGTTIMSEDCIANVLAKSKYESVGVQYQKKHRSGRGDAILTRDPKEPLDVALTLEHRLQFLAGFSITKQYNFETSMFKVLYDLVSAPQRSYQAFEALHIFLQEVLPNAGAPVDRWRLMYESKLNPVDASSGHMMEESVAVQQWFAQLWTSDVPVAEGKTFYQLLQRSIQADGASLTTAMPIVRAINAHIKSSSLQGSRSAACGAVAPLQFPALQLGVCSRIYAWLNGYGEALYRGSSMPEDQADFFTAMLGKTYRAQLYLATSWSKGAAVNFMNMGYEQRRCLFTIRTPVAPYHASSLEGLTLLAGEFEVLFAPWSSFKVLAVSGGRATGDGTPLYVDLEALPDNQTCDVAGVTSWH